jgi:hypothetical protein
MLRAIDPGTERREGSNAKRVQEPIPAQEIGSCPEDADRRFVLRQFPRRRRSSEPRPHDRHVDLAIGQARVEVIPFRHRGAQRDCRSHRGHQSQEVPPICARGAAPRGNELFNRLRDVRDGYT